MPAVMKQDLRSIVDKAVKEVRVTDIHTHLYSADFGGLLFWGMDKLLTYHYLIAETFRFTDMALEDFWKISEKEQADLIWKTLFLENSPYSEACRGVLTVLQKLGLNPHSRDLDSYRSYFNNKTVEEFIEIAFETAGIQHVVMTNDPFDDLERRAWERGISRDERFLASLRVDILLNSWDTAWPALQSWGYHVEEELNETTLSEVRRFLREWVDRIKAVYMAVSLPQNFRFPEESKRSKLIEHCVLPVCRNNNIPTALMIGVKRQVNPSLKLAGDAVGKADIGSVNYLCANYPHNKFMVTMLSRENQHELCISARKFRNLLVFGCWWFLNNPSLIDEITRMRIELLGSSFIPQHSDARVLDQLIYKWTHSRQIIADVLYDKYSDLMATGWTLTQEEIRRDIEKLFGGTFWEFQKGEF